MESVREHVRPDADSRLVLRSRLGAITLVLLCAVQFLDIVDSAIVNVALPSIQHSLALLAAEPAVGGERLHPHLRRLPAARRPPRRPARAPPACCSPGSTVFAVTSLTAGLASSSGLLVAARLVQGIGAALMAPAALSELTTSFREGKDRNTALGVWGAISGMAAAAGVFLGGVSRSGTGMAMGLLRQPADLRPGGGRRAPPAAERPRARSEGTRPSTRRGRCS